jgi:hypothetical protein
MSNIMIDDDEINLRKPCSIPVAAPFDIDECDSMLPPKKPSQQPQLTTTKMNGFECIDCIDTLPPPFPSSSNGKLNGNHHNNSYANTSSLSSIKKHYNQDNSENYASENNLLSKCCNGNAAMGSDVSIADANDVNSSASSLISIKSMPLSNSNEACRSALTVYNKQPQPTNFSNSNRNRPRLSLSSNTSSGSSNNNCAVNQQQQPAVHGRNNNNGLPTGQRTRLSTHQRNLSLDFR